MASKIRSRSDVRDAVWEILPELDTFHSIEAAQNSIVDNISDGSFCAVCGQLAKAYPRKLNANMVAYLISLSLKHRRIRDWIHHSECFHKGRDYPYIATWGLAMTKPNDDVSKGRSGLWMPTKKGGLFTRDKEIVPAHMFVYDNHVVGQSVTETDVRTALGNSFNYAEMMSGNFPSR